MVMAALADAGLPVPRPLVPSGPLIWNGRPVHVSQWIEHDGSVRGWDALPAVSSALAQMHDVMSACDVSPEPPSGDRWVPVRDLMRQLMAAGPRLIDAAGDGYQEVEAALDRVESLCERLSDAGNVLQVHGNIQLTHGDFTGRNVLLLGERLAAIVDFGRMDRRPRLYDLAYLLFWPLRTTVVGEPTTSQLAAIRNCCEAYGRATGRTVSQSEWRVLAHMLALLPVAGVAGAVAEVNPVAEVREFARGLDLAEYALDHDQLASRLPR